jgi:hypothetical protein
MLKRLARTTARYSCTTLNATLICMEIKKSLGVLVAAAAPTRSVSLFLDVDHYIYATTF